MTANPSFPSGRVQKLDLMKQLLLAQEPGEYAYFSNVSWQEYDKLCQLRDEERKGVRLAYDNGELWVMTVGYPHERYKSLLAHMIVMACVTFDKDFSSSGNLTVRREDLSKGLDPDTSFYIQHFKDVQITRELNFELDPPPDLAVESEVSSNINNKLSIYSDLGVREIWRTDGQQVVFLLLDDQKNYVPVPVSETFPQVTSVEVEEFFLRAVNGSEKALINDWVVHLKSKTV